MITIVTGGARSGKSTFAEARYEGIEDVVYIATSIVEDGEMEDRVRKHRAQRPEIWRTFEAYKGLEKAVGKEDNYLLDCLTNMTSNIMFEETKHLDRIDDRNQKRVEDLVVGEMEKLIQAVRQKDGNLIIVTNELGSSIVPEHHLSRVFRDVQGRINQRVAAMCDEAYLVAMGLAVRLK